MTRLTEIDGKCGTHGVAVHHSPMMKLRETLNTLQSSRWEVSDFRFIEVLGQGRASTVYRAVHVEGGMEFAIKKCFAANLTTRCERQRLEQEIAVHSSVFHPTIATFFGSFMDSKGNIYLILEYAKKGDLFSLLYSPEANLVYDDADANVLSEADICQRIMGPLVSAVACLHANDIIHCDIKPENLILCRNDRFCLADFGFVTDLKRQRAITRWGREGKNNPDVNYSFFWFLESHVKKNVYLYDDGIIIFHEIPFY